MIRFVMVASLLVGCRISLEPDSPPVTGRACVVNTTSATCVDAAGHADLAWIQNNVFTSLCAFSGCHNGDNTPQGKIDLRSGKSHTSLVMAPSVLEPTRMLVVPNDIQASYLMLMLHDFDPAMAMPPGTAPRGDVGYMPQGNMPLCCQKMDAIERWIMAGAPTN